MKVTSNIIKSAIALALTVGASSAFADTYRHSIPIQGLQFTEAPSGGEDTPPPSTAAITLSPSSLDFTLTAVGQTQDLPFTLTNSGNSSLLNVRAIISSSEPVFSLVSNSCGVSGNTVSVPAGASCSGVVRFSPSLVNSFMGSLALDATNSDNGIQSVALSAQSGAPSLSASQTSFDFGTSYNTPTSRTVEISNSGSITASGVFATIPSLPNVTVTANTCGTSGSPIALAPNATCSIALTYASSTTSQVAGVVSVVAAGGAPSVDIPVQGFNKSYASFNTTSGSNISVTTTSVVSQFTTSYGKIVVNRPISSGKHYIEVAENSYRSFIGITSAGSNLFSETSTPTASNYYLDNKASAVAMYMTDDNSRKLYYINATAGAAVTPVATTPVTHANLSSTQIYGLAIDADNNVLSWYNGTGVLIGQATVSMPKPWYFAVARGNSLPEGALNFTLRNSSVLNGRAPAGFTPGIFDQ